MTEQAIIQYGKRDDIKELATRLQKMMPGAGQFSESEALAVAQVAVAHGLDPFNGEVWGIKYEKPAGSGTWVWAGVMVGVKGLRKSARRQGNYWTEFRRVEPATYNAAASAVVWECHLRDTERVMAYGKAINALTSSGMPYTEAVQMLGPAPVYIGVGIATPDERSKMGLHARSKKRAEADAIKQAYDVQFGGAMLENGSVVGDGVVSVLGFDDDHQLPATVRSEPRTTEAVLADMGIVVVDSHVVSTSPDIEPVMAEDDYVVDEDGNAIVGNEVIGTAPVIEEPHSFMTLEMAAGIKNSKGVAYTDIDSKTLSHMATELQKSLANNGLTPEEREMRQMKLDAALVVMKSRAS